jgi:hypothetical protein
MAKVTRAPTIFDNIDFPDYQFKEYPKVLYGFAENVDGFTTTIVESPSDERALGKGWFATPKEAKGARPGAVKPPVDSGTDKPTPVDETDKPTSGKPAAKL